MAKLSPNLRGALLALLAFAIYAGHDVVVKLLGAHYPAVQIVFFATLLGFPLVTLMMIRDRSDGNLRPRHPGWIALRTGALVISGLAAFYAFGVLPLAQTYAILFSMPLLITLLSVPVLGERVGPRRGLAVLVGLAGVLIVLRPGAAPLGLGHLAALVAALGSALSSVIMRKIGQHERNVVLLVYPMMANVVLMSIALPFVYVPVPVGHLAGFAAVALFAFLAMLVLIMAYRDGEAVIVAPMQYSQILWAAFYGYAIFGEAPDGATVLGAAVIIASGLYIVLRESRATVSENRPVLTSRARSGLAVFPRGRPFRRRPAGAGAEAAEGGNEPLANPAGNR